MAIPLLLGMLERQRREERAREEERRRRQEEAALSPMPIIGVMSMLDSSPDPLISMPDFAPMPDPTPCDTFSGGDFGGGGAGGDF